MNPLISICLPVLNTRPYLPERFETIYSQTLDDWELVVHDNGSDDGAWEYIQEMALKEPRMRISHGPKLGVYPAWNECLRQAKGEFIYIATSDDTMAADCIEKLAAALRAHPECDIAHCRLRMIDQDGKALEDWWPEMSLFARSSGELWDRPHIRRAPHDGLLHLSGETVYISITQLLIRRTLFDKVGKFEPAWGSVGDFNWDMRAGLVANTVHVPDTWGGWRVHAAQATAKAGLRSSEHYAKVEEMIRNAIERSAGDLAQNIKTGLVSDWAPKTAELREFAVRLRSFGSRSRSKRHIAREWLAGRMPARLHVAGKLRGQPVWPDSTPQMVRDWLSTVGISQPLVAV